MTTWNDIQTTQCKLLEHNDKPVRVGIREGEGGTMGVAPAGQTENIREQMTPTTTQANGRTETMILTTVILPRDIKLKDEDTLWTFVCVISSKSESV